MILDFEHANDEFFDVHGASPDVIRFCHQITSEIIRAFSIAYLPSITTFCSQIPARSH
jgi:hypothetical protein